MLDALLRADRALLGWVEETWRSPWLDGPMHVLSTLAYFLPVLVPLWIWLVWKGGVQGRRVALGVLVLVLVTDQLSASALRPLFARPRPHSASFGFPSSHAANVFGQAAFLARFYPRLTALFFSIAAAVGFSRVYLGKHYPLDVVAGAGLGVACGLLLAHLVRRHAEQVDRLWLRVLPRLAQTPPR